LHRLNYGLGHAVSIKILDKKIKGVIDDRVNGSGMKISVFDQYIALF